jgi:hypothetical protein
MRVWITPAFLACLIVVFFAVPEFAQDSTQKNPSSSSSSSRSKKAPPKAPAKSGIDDGKVSAGVYRNASLGLTCNVLAGWVLRTAEMNARDTDIDQIQNSSPQGTQRSTGDNSSGRVLLAAFSRPPEATGEEVNASIVIAAEPVAAYPGLTEALQYVAPLTEVAKAQGFEADEDPYEVAIGPKTLVQVDFHKNVGSRVMRQSTLIFLARGYVISMTLIGGTEDEVGDLVDGLSFSAK